MTCVLQNLKGGKEVFPSTLKQDLLDFSCFLKIFNPLRRWFHRSFCNLKIRTMFSFQGTWSSLQPVEVYYSLFSMSWWQDKAYSLLLFMHSLIYYFFSQSLVLLKALILCLGWNASDGIVETSTMGFLEVVLNSSVPHKRWALSPVRCCYVPTMVFLWCLVVQAAIRKGGVLFNVPST